MPWHGAGCKASLKGPGALGWLLGAGADALELPGMCCGYYRSCEEQVTCDAGRLKLAQQGGFLWTFTQPGARMSVCPGAPRACEAAPAGVRRQMAGIPIHGFQEVSFAARAPLATRGTVLGF